MRVSICFSFLLVSFIGYTQNVFEYSLVNKLIFKVYGEDEGRYYKISNKEDFKQDSPENVAVSSFFAYSNDLGSKLYLDKKNYYIKDDEDFEGIKKTKKEDAYVQLLHKTNYRLDGDELCYIMFIARVKGTDFPFPTLLPLIKKDSRWYINTRPNQEKFTTSLKMLKPCVLSNMIEGFSEDSDVKSLILKTKSNTSGVDFSKLFDELASIKKNDKVLFNKLTMAQNANCSEYNFKNNVESENTITSILKEASIQEIKKQDLLLISKLKKDNDSILLKNKLEFIFSKKNMWL